jgi:hypothetical protein
MKKPNVQNLEHRNSLWVLEVVKFSFEVPTLAPQECVTFPFTSPRHTYSKLIYILSNIIYIGCYQLNVCHSHYSKGFIYLTRKNTYILSNIYHLIVMFNSLVGPAVVKDNQCVLY